MSSSSDLSTDYYSSSPRLRPEPVYYPQREGAQPPSTRFIYPFYPNYRVRQIGNLLSLDEDYQFSDSSEQPSTYFFAQASSKSSGPRAFFSSSDNTMLGTCALTQTARTFSLSGQSCVLTPKVLQATDREAADFDLLYYIKEVSSGSIVQVAQSGSRQEVKNFTQRQINNGDIVFQHKYVAGEFCAFIFESIFHCIFLMLIYSTAGPPHLFFPGN